MCYVKSQLINLIKELGRLPKRSKVWNKGFDLVWDETTVHAVDAHVIYFGMGQLGTEGYPVEAHVCY